MWRKAYGLRTQSLHWSGEPVLMDGAEGGLQDPIKLERFYSAEPNCAPPRLRQRLPSFPEHLSTVHVVSSTSRLRLFLKRAIDVLLSAAALFLLWPVMLLVAVAVKLESPGPILYSARRAGKKGREFVCYKFRTMVDGAEALKTALRIMNERRGPFFKISADPRITPLGRLLRKYSLDELPQLWNVLKGDMSLVGPRPHPLDDVALYQPAHRPRLEVKPGLTGLWQVTARTDPSFATCLELDLTYIRKWSLLLDCRILAKTIPEVLSGSGE